MSLLKCPVADQAGLDEAGDSHPRRGAVAVAGVTDPVLNEAVCGGRKIGFSRSALVRLLCFFLLSGFLAASAVAGPNPEKAAPIQDGKDLLKVLRLALRACNGEQLKTEQEKLDASHAIGYIDGLKEASWVLDYANDSVPYILPTNIKNEQLAQVILRYLTLHPEKQDKSSYAIVALAFTEVFRNPKWKPLPDGPKSPEKSADGN